MILENRKKLMRLKKSDLMDLIQKKGWNYSPALPTKKDLVEAIIAHQIVAKFNDMRLNKGFFVKLRRHRHARWLSLIPRSEAFVPRSHNLPVAFFEGVPGWHIISEQFCEF